MTLLVSSHRMLRCYKKRPVHRATSSNKRAALIKKKVKVKVNVYSPDIPSRFRGLYISYPQVLEPTLSQSHLSGENAAETIHTVLIFVPPGTHCYRVDRGSVDSKPVSGEGYMVFYVASNPFLLNKIHISLHCDNSYIGPRVQSH